MLLVRQFWKTHLYVSSNNQLITRNNMQFAQAKKNSEWIYSSKAQQMSHIHKGKIFLCTDVGEDTHNCTLRMHKSIFQSNVILAYNKLKIERFLKALSQKDRFVLDSLQSSSTQLAKPQSTGMVQFTQQKFKKIEYNIELQMSKHLQMSMDQQQIKKGNNDRENIVLKKHQDQLLQFMKVNSIKLELDQIKGSQGYPKVVPLLQSMQDIQKMHNCGINTLCFLHQFEIQCTAKLIKYLQERELPFQILPATNTIVNLTAGTGFPADRFCIEYFPASVEDVLRKRKMMKMTISMIIRSDQVYPAVEQISKIYGKDHLIYLDIGKSPFRGEVYTCFQYLQHVEINEKYCKIAVAPFISDFNEELKEETSKKSRLYGEALADGNNFVKMEMIAKELENLMKKDSTYEINVQTMIIQLYERVKDDQIVLKVLKQIINVPQKVLISMIKTAKSKMVGDVIGLKDMMTPKGKKQRKKTDDE